MEVLNENAALLSNAENTDDGACGDNPAGSGTCTQNVTPSEKEQAGSNLEIGCNNNASAIPNDIGNFVNQKVLSILESFKKGLKEPKYTRQNVNEMNQLSDKEKNLQSLNTVVYETVKYLEETPCVSQTPEHIQNFLTAINQYNLTKGEKLQILNLRPTSLVQIQLLIEESEERFTEDQLNEILTVIADILPPGPESDNTAVSEADYDENG